MPRDDTSVGGPRGFDTTRWSLVLGSADPASPTARENLDSLVRKYWKPVYAYIRASWRKSNEDAKDLTQEFFTQLLERGAIAHLSPEKGSFRGYLKLALKHFLIDASRRQKAQRPEGMLFWIPAHQLENMAQDRPEEPPDRALDREWFRCVMEASIRGLRRELTKQGKRVYFDAFELYCLEPSGGAAELLRNEERAPPTYATVARHLNVQVTDVQNFLGVCREMLHGIVWERIRSYCASYEDVERELRDIISG